MKAKKLISVVQGLTVGHCVYLIQATAIVVTTNVPIYSLLAPLTHFFVASLLPRSQRFIHSGPDSEEKLRKLI